AGARSLSRKESPARRRGLRGARRSRGGRRPSSSPQRRPLSSPPRRPLSSPRRRGDAEENAEKTIDQWLRAYQNPARRSVKFGRSIGLVPRGKPSSKLTAETRRRGATRG